MGLSARDLWKLLVSFRRSASSWFPFLLGLLIGRGAADFGLFIVLVFFIFIPGVYFVANTPNWGKLARASASLGYVAAAEVIAYFALRAGSQVSGG